MPIKLEDIEKANRRPQDKILEALTRAPDAAMSVPEIYAVMHEMAPELGGLVLAMMTPENRARHLAATHEVLSEMVGQRVIAEVSYQGQPYFHRPRGT